MYQSHLEILEYISIMCLPRPGQRKLSGFCFGPLERTLWSCCMRSPVPWDHHAGEALYRQASEAQTSSHPRQSALDMEGGSVLNSHPICQSFIPLSDLSVSHGAEESLLNLAQILDTQNNEVQLNGYCLKLLHFWCDFLCNRWLLGKEVTKIAP